MQAAGGAELNGANHVVNLSGNTQVSASGPLAFSTGNPDGKMATASRPSSTGNPEIESADDFLLTSPTELTSATFTGLVPTGSIVSGAGSVVQQVVVEIYLVFPQNSTNPPNGDVPTRVNSPSDVELEDRDSMVGNLTFTTTVLNANFAAANSVVTGINPIPNQTTGGEGAVNGEEVQFNVTFTTPFLLPANHYFFVPQVLAEQRQLPVVVGAQADHRAGHAVQSGPARVDPRRSAGAELAAGGHRHCRRRPGPHVQCDVLADRHGDGGAVPVPQLDEPDGRPGGGRHHRHQHRGGAVQINVTTAGGGLTVASPIASSGGNISLKADGMSFLAAVNAGAGRVSLDTNNSTRPITLGGTPTLPRFAAVDDNTASLDLWTLNNATGACSRPGNNERAGGLHGAIQRRSEPLRSGLRAREFPHHGDPPARRRPGRQLQQRRQATQGLGTTISASRPLVWSRPSSPAALPGLTNALGILQAGFVIVGNVAQCRRRGGRRGGPSRCWTATATS